MCYFHSVRHDLTNNLHCMQFELKELKRRQEDDERRRQEEIALASGAPRVTGGDRPDAPSRAETGSMKSGSEYHLARDIDIT